MAVQTPTYSTEQAITLDISSLATSSTFLAGVESGQIDNTTDKYMHAMVNVKPILGHASTAPVVGQMIRLFVWGSTISLATTAIDVLDGTSSAETLAHAGVLNSLAEVPPAVVTVATAGLQHIFLPFDPSVILRLPALPPYWGLFIAHNHAGALAAAQTALFTFRGIKYDVT